MKWSNGIRGFYIIFSSIFFFARVSDVHASDPFTQVVLPDTGNYMSCSWGDYDADGYDDLFFGNDDGHNILYHNDRNGTLGRVTSGAIAQNNKHGWGSTWGDYDGDGDLDLFISRFARSEDLLYSNNADDTFELITSNAILINSASNYSSSWADYDNDNDLDLFVPVTDNIHNINNMLYQNQGSGTFTLVTTGTIVNDSGYSQSCSWGDYDNDGFPDLFVANYEENNFLYHNNRDGTFTKIIAGPIVNESNATFGGSWGDFDNDGDLDLFIANDNAQNNSLYRNEVAGAFSKVLSGEIVNDGGNSVGTVWGDFDNDGDLDLFVSNRYGENNFLYMNNGDGTFSRNTSSCITNDDGNFTGCASSDFDHDGDLDICIANWYPGGNQENYLYVNNGNDNNYVNIRCIGKISNSSAIGAKVRLKAHIYGKSYWQLRELSAAAGYCAQNSLNAHFGLGDATTIDSIKIEWPSGIDQILTNISINSFLTFTEPSDSKQGDQFNPRIVSTPAGGYIIIFLNMIDSRRNIIAQRFDKDNNPLGDPFRVNDQAWGSSPYLYETLDISVLDDGSFVIVWEQNGTQKISGQRYTKDGEKIGSNFEIYNGRQPAVAINNDDGSFLVVYKHSYGIHGQRYDYFGNPIGEEIIISKIMEYHRYPAVTVTPHGDYIVVWEAEVSMGVVRIYGQRFDHEGNAIGGNFRIDDDPEHYWKNTPDIATSYDGSFLVVWQDYRGDEYGIFGQRYDNSGNKSGVNFKINDVDVTPNPRAPAISSNSDGNFVVSWEDYRNGDADIYAQIFNHQGAMIGSNDRIDDDTGHSEQKNPDVAYSKNQIFHVWQDDRVSDEGWNIRTKAEEIQNVTIHVPYDYSTIQEAIDAASSGDTILVAPGTYNISASICNDRLNNLQLIGSRKEDGSNASIIVPADNQESFSVIRFSNVSGCVLSGFEIKNTANYGIYFGDCSNCLIKQNYIHNNDMPGIHVVEARDVKVTSCIVSSNGVAGIYFFCCDESQIINNTVVSNAANGITLEDSWSVIIKNNIIAWNEEEGIISFYSSGNLLHDYNCFWQNEGIGNISKYDSGGFSKQPIGPHSFDADPMLVDVDNQNYHLLPGSPCLGAGEDGVDIGAMGLQQLTCLLGDVNDDGEVTPGDALCAFYIYLYGGVPPAECDNPCALTAADINCTPDGITPGDALYIFQAYLQDFDPPLACKPGAFMTKPIAKEQIRHLTIPNFIRKADDEIIVPLQMNTATGISAFGMCLSYPADLLTFSNASNGNLTEAWEYLEANETEPGLLVIGGFHQSPILSNDLGNLVQLTFRIKPGGNGEGEFMIVDPTDDLLQASATPAKFSISKEGITMLGSSTLPQDYALRQNYPNPFNLETRINYALPADGHVTIKIYNLLGMEVETLVDDYKDAGYYSLVWNGRNQIAASTGSGLYICKIRVNDFRKSIKMLLLK